MSKVFEYIYNKNDTEIDKVYNKTGNLVYNNQKTLSGVSPLTFKSRGANLVNYRIYGNSNSVGDLITDTTDENYGKYKISIAINGKNLLKNTAAQNITHQGVSYITNNDGSIKQ